MQLILLADDDQRQELLNNTDRSDINVVVLKNVESLVENENTDAIIDLLFDGAPERVELLKKYSKTPVIVNSVIQTLQKINAPFVRINAWPGFLKRSVVEASTSNKKVIQQVEDIFSKLGKKVQWVPDKPGFVTARVIAMIINEAWFALGEDISTKKEIDAAMKLGTNYPQGPFEWCNQIGINNIKNLLSELAKTDERYQPAPLLAHQTSG